MTNDLHNSSAFTRRSFLGRGITLASAALTVPAWVESSARALAAPAGAGTSIPGSPQERILVVVQLSGGNDGLNTVIPLGERAYYDARPGIAIPEPEILRLDSRVSVGLHPRLEGLKSLYEDGLLSVVQSVGYPNPNRSHFSSMDIWHTADPSGAGVGWLGKYFDCECAGRDPKRRAPGATAETPGAATDPAAQSEADGLSRSGIAIGRTAPRALEGRLTRPIAFESPELFRWTGAARDERADAAYERLMAQVAPPPAAAGAPGARPSPESNAEFLSRTAMDARIASDRIRRAVAADPLAQYPRGELGRQLQMVGAMIRAGLSTRVYYVSLGGFDTHAGQGGANGRHAQLMNEYASSLRAFYFDLKAQGNDGRVLTMAFSEFGRRVRQNASGGTDHGAAAPMFLAGPMVRAGVLNPPPSLTDLDDGDVKFDVDFRTVYAAVIADWMRGDARAALGASYAPAKIIRA